MKDNIDKISKSTGSVLTKFEDIDQNVRIVAEQEHNIRASMEEQEAGSQQILQGVSVLSDINKQVETGSQEMLEGSAEVIKETENLEMATQEIKNGIDEMASGADQINVAVNEVNEITNKNQRIISTVLNEVFKFKL